MLVDTDVLIWYLRGHEKAARFLDNLQELKLSAITWMELVQGCRNRQELERLKKDFSRRQAVILPVSDAISERAMALMETHFLGDGLLLADALIASTAIEHTLTLSSANSPRRAEKRSAFRQRSVHTAEGAALFRPTLAVRLALSARELRAL